MKRIFTIILLLSCIACNQKEETVIIKVAAIKSRKAIKISGIDYAILSEINRDSTLNKWQSLAPVFKMPKDTDLKSYQSVQLGKYTIVNKELVFTPDTPFNSAETYFVRFFKFADNNSLLDYATGKKKLKQVPYQDFVF